MSVPPTSVFAVITGGGTSGHVVPALAISELLVEAGHPLHTLHYVGSSRGIETSLVAPTGLASTLLVVDGLQRSFHPKSLIRNLKMPHVMLGARRSAVALLQSLQPKVVISVGGYASIPTCSAARKLGIPVVVVSYDRRPGLASRLQSRSSAANAVAYLPSALQRAQLAGAPVRAAIRHCQRQENRDAALRLFGFRSTDQVVLAMGGSLGSARINAAISTLVTRNDLDANIAILHIAGKRNMSFDTTPEVLLRPDGSLRYRRIAYCDDMASAYSASSVVVARAGASTIAEIATVGVASILIPWKDAAENHQVTNAQWLANAGAATMLEEGDMTDATFATNIVSLLSSPTMIADYETKSRELGDVHRNCRIAAIVESVA
jgi:UDP-N-acetylglucosamine--N-acetylmuramyl-(pentapeptide) pyrophosphoryl-undecaprenol N-acetylglucosamine transferase